MYALTPDNIASLRGAENARMMVIGMFCLSVYDLLISLDDEIRCFWTGRWTLSRALFFINRYLNPAICVLALACVSLPDPSIRVCRQGIQLLFVVSTLALGIVQAMLAIRVWYLFASSRAMRLFIVAASVVTNVLSLYLAVREGVDMKVQPHIPGVLGCHATRPPMFWRLFLPSLVLHTVLYILTAYRALRNRAVFKEAPILKRLLRDGGFFYFAVFLSVLFTSIGSFLNQYPSINVPAIFSNFSVTTTSIAASRIMLSIHSLAHKLGSDSAWLLNNVELSRVPWRRGATEGEIIVERFSTECPDAEVDGDVDVDVESGGAGGRGVPLKTSRVGRWTDETW
ncbi:unnamed protein product [Mycena citricolor]|uniref:DUF6533 domain-containing protein n=1 Tax=Mycena citricolor TaxID=2018698 RepID=A0AAD2Q1L9_9AGAR|nr:unnamed protein product [Mycena citricolor]